MNSKPSISDANISQLRQLLRELHEQKLELLNTMMNCGQMIAGSVYQTYRTCSYANCRCRRGEKHGPFPSISFSVDGKRRSRPIRRDDVEVVGQKVAAYKRFQKALTRWRALHRQSETILKKIREFSLEPYP